MRTALDIVAVVQALAACRDPEAVCAVLAESTRALIGADGVTVVLRDGERCRYVEEHALGPLWKGRDFAVGECISGWCMAHDAQVAIPDIRVDHRIPQALYADTFVRSLVMTPIGHHPPMGAMGTYWADFHEASTDERAALHAIADSAALALVNVQLLGALQEANARKEQFLASLAHEIGALLGPLRTSLHLQHDLADRDSQRRARDIMTRQVARQARLVDHLLEGSELLTGQVGIAREPLDLIDVVAAAVEARRGDAAAADIALRYLRPIGAIRVAGDARRLEQALAHVLENSLRCTPPGGTVAVTSGIEDDMAVVRVEDSGIGISPQALPHVFEPFFKPAHEPERSLAGVGLGLSMVARIAALHGGTAVVESAGSGQGTRVTLRLPLRRAEPATPPRMAGAAH